MIAAVCIDDRGGMLFNHRRQSQDRLLREDLLAEAAGRPLWMNSYSLRQFPTPPPNLCVDEGFLDPAPWRERMEGVILYRWNRTYPADLRLTLSLEGWSLERREIFAGSSHEKIIKEVYRR